MSLPRHDWKPTFLAALEKVPVITHAARIAEVDRSTVFRTRQADPEFAKAVEDAMEAGIDTAEREMYRRAVQGWEEPVIDKGRLCYRTRIETNDQGEERYVVERDADGKPIPLTIRKHSDMLMVAYIKGRRKQVFAERTELTGADGAPLQQMDDTARAARVAQLVAIAKQRAAAAIEQTFDDLA